MRTSSKRLSRNKGSKEKSGKESRSPDEVLVRRVLSDRECATWYPNNAEVLAYNRALRQLDDASARPGAVAEGDIQRSKKSAAADGSFESVERTNKFTKPRTLVFSSRYEGVPAISVWTGYAVLVVDKAVGLGW